MKRRIFWSYIQLPVFQAKFEYSWTNGGYFKRNTFILTWLHLFQMKCKYSLKKWHHLKWITYIGIIWSEMLRVLSYIHSKWNMQTLSQMQLVFFLNWIVDIVETNAAPNCYKMEILSQLQRFQWKGEARCFWVTCYNSKWNVNILHPSK